MGNDFSRIAADRAEAKLNMDKQDLARAARATARQQGLAVVCASHWISHFHMFVLPLLFPFLRDEFGVGYIELGLALRSSASSRV